MSDHDGHDTKLTIPVDLEDARCWLLGGEGQQVENGCLRWLRRYSRGLCSEVLQDITHSAMAEGYAAFHAEKLSIPETLLRVQRCLNRLREREDKHRARELGFAGQISKVPDSMDRYEEIIEKDFWRQFVQFLERHMMPAFLSLSSRDQDILGVYYGLEEIGDPLRAPVYPTFPSAEAEKKALQRARRRFNEHLETLLERDLDVVRKFDRPLYQAALRFVKGGKLERVFASVGRRARKNDGC